MVRSSALIVVLILLTVSLNLSTALALPDFVVTSVNGPSTAEVGSQISVKVTFKNQGTSPTQGTYVLCRMIVSPDTQINLADAYYVDRQISNSYLEAGESRTETFYYTLPSNFNGQFWVGGYADAATYHTESNENNNANYDSSPLTIGYFALAIPSNFNAVQINNGIRLTWDETANVGGSASYRIYWGTSPGVDENNKAGILLTDNITFDHTGLDAGIPYYYKIKACNDSGCSDLSSEQSAVAPLSDLTISLQALSTENAQRGGSFPITCTINRTGGLLRPTTDFARVYVYMNQSPDSATVIPAEHRVLEDDGSPFDLTADSLDDGTETVNNFSIPIPTTIEGPHYIHVKVDGPGFWSESNEANNWATSSRTVAVWRDEVPTTVSDNGILARTWDDSKVYWISKYGKKWQLTGIQSDPGYVVTKLGYTDADVHWYRSGALDGLESAMEIVNDIDSKFVYRRQENETGDSTVYIVRNGVSDWFYNWDTFINSEFGTEDVYWATDIGFDWIQANYALGQMVGLQPRIRVLPNKLIFK